MDSKKGFHNSLTIPKSLFVIHILLGQFVSHVVSERNSGRCELLDKEHCSKVESTSALKLPLLLTPKFLKS